MAVSHHHAEFTSQLRGLPMGSVPCSVLNTFRSGRGTAHKAYLIRRCVGRTNSVPSELEDGMSPPDGEFFFFFFSSKAGESKQV